MNDIIFCVLAKVLLGAVVLRGFGHVILLYDMQRLIRYGRFGSFYGSMSGIAFGVLVALYVAVDTLSRWPEDGTLSWF